MKKTPSERHDAVKAEGRLGAFYSRTRAHAGGKQANVAAAHRLAIIIYDMVKNQTEYD